MLYFTTFDFYDIFDLSLIFYTFF